MRWGGAAADDEDALYLWCQSRGEFGCVGGLCDEEVKSKLSPPPFPLKL